MEDRLEQMASALRPDKKAQESFLYATTEDVLHHVNTVLNQKPTSPLSTEERRILERYIAFNAAHATKKGHISRESYDSIDQHLIRMLHDAKERKQEEKVHVIDFGAARCQYISSIREKDVDVTAVSLDDYPDHDPVDRYLNAAFENLPQDVQGSADVAVSHVAWQYSLLPHIALRNMAASLTSGGEAVLHYGQPQVFYELTQGIYGDELLQETRTYLNEQTHKTSDTESGFVEMQEQARTLIMQELYDLQQQGFVIHMRAEFHKPSFHIEENIPLDHIQETPSVIHHVTLKKP